VRAFIAVDIPDNLRRSLAEVAGRLGGLGGDVKWVRPAGIHVTLKFLGEIGEERVDEVAEAMARAAAGKRPFEVTLAGLGAFPPKGPPRVIWVGIDRGAEELTRLAAEVDCLCAGLGFEPERRPFRAHVTLGRVRSPRGIGKLADEVRGGRGGRGGGAGGAGGGGWSGFSAEPFMAGSVKLMRSDLRPSGAVYTCLREVALGQEAG